MSQPKISVIVPVYNVEKYLSKCLDSILAQDFDDFEIIAVDDESPDKCGEILDEYEVKYPNKVVVIHQKNKGLGGARNTGIDAANGEYLLFVDSDDYIAPNMLSLLMNEIEQSEADIAVCGITYVDENGNAWKNIDTGFNFHQRYEVNEYKNLITISPAACNKLYKKELFINNSIYYPERVWYEDIRTTVKLISCAESVVFTDECPYYYLQREGSIIHSGNIERNQEILLAFDDIFSYFKQNALYEKFFNELEFITVRSVLWDSSVRVLKITKYHPLLDKLREYCFNLFPNCFNNHYFRDFINENKLMRTIFFFCLRNQLYSLLYLILKIKG